jgi:hypothetical protein
MTMLRGKGVTPGAGSGSGMGIRLCRSGGREESAASRCLAQRVHDPVGGRAASPRVRLGRQGAGLGQRRPGQGLLLRTGGLPATASPSACRQSPGINAITRALAAS